ncbi:MAG: hypothetical protein JW829_01455 [Pirellulales bacterium]|nr:hypothetical protein [Pirellulales bacterium]
MIIINRLVDLTIEELARIRETILDRYGSGPRDNIIDIAFGLAEKGTALDPSRLNAICFYVRSKRDPQSKADRIPRTIEVRLRRNGHFELVQLPSDIIEIGTAAIKPSGRQICHLSKSRKTATAGCVIAWKAGTCQEIRWGVLTVGHLFWSISPVPEQERLVRISIPSNQVMPGFLLARTLKNDGSGMDAALVSVMKSTLVRAGLVPRDVSTRGKKIRSVDQLRLDRRRAGLALPGRMRIPFVVVRYMPESRLVPDAGCLRHVFEVHSLFANAFGHGKSGSLWLVGGSGAGIQYAGYDTPGRPGLRYTRGLGQALIAIIDWARSQIARLENVPNEEIDIRVIREL